MVSFQCDGCADTVKKPKLDQHRQRCWASFTCLDCSTTFQGQDYKQHTSCISEAEKYQGALYKGPKSQKVHVVSPIPSVTASSNIHPSRINQLESEPRREVLTQARKTGRGRAGPSAENRLEPNTTMRTWGPAEPETTPPVVAKKKRRKGDKGGTGSKANSKRARSEISEAQPEDVNSASQASKVGAENSEPVAKKVKREKSGQDKTLKRIKKNMSKLEGELALSVWLEKLGKGKQGAMDTGTILEKLKVKLVDGTWQLDYA